MLMNIVPYPTLLVNSHDLNPVNKTILKYKICCIKYFNGFIYLFSFSLDSIVQ